MDCGIKIILTNGENFCMGPGVVHLLKEIDKTGAVSAAAKNLGISYSKAWKMIRLSESGFGETLVNRSSGGMGGGKAFLTENCKTYIAAFEKTEKEIGAYSQKIIRKNFS